LFSISRQFFFTYAVMGSVLPFLPVFLAERGLSRTEIGYVIGAASLGIALTPVIVTWLADTAIAGRVLLSCIFALAGVMLVALLGAEGFWAIFSLYALHAFVFAPTTPLQDGIYFTELNRRELQGRPALPYHIVRVFGTAGYILPSVILYFFLGRSETVTPAMAVGAGFCAVGLLNALILPAGRGPAPPHEGSRLPTAAAARAMLEPHVLVFCIGMFLAHAAAAAYYQFYPIHLTDRAGIDKRWVGLIANIGVLVEIPFIIGFGWLVQRLTLRRVMALGALFLTVRMVLLGSSDTVSIAVGTQVLHGMTVLLIHICAPVFLNRRARDEYRNSIQGLYTVAVLATGRMSGSLVAGYVADAVSLQAMFYASAGMSLVAAVLFHFAFREHGVRPPEQEAALRSVHTPAGDEP
jgi:MFS transporter, PPP family, 3-phenylpropionic acid transporter